MSSARTPIYKEPQSELVKNLIEMQKLYVNTEYQFLQFNEIVPYTHNPLNVYSPTLVHLLLSIGPQIYGMFEILTKQAGIQPTGNKFPHYYDALNGKEGLSCQTVLLQESNLTRSPFKDRDNIPWWDAYNTVKHDMPNGIFEAKLENVIDALSALFILHHIADVAQRDHRRGPAYENPDFLNSENWIKVTTVGQYVYYKSKQGNHSSLHYGFLSNVLIMNRRFLPHLRGEKIDPN